MPVDVPVCHQVWLSLSQVWTASTRRRYRCATLWGHSYRLWTCRTWITELKIYCLNTLRPRQNGRHFPDDIFKCIFLNENGRISIKMSLKIVPKGPINYIPALVQIMAWRRPGDKPLSEPMLVSLLMHVCVTRPQWFNTKIVHLRVLSLDRSKIHHITNL